eukprot:2115565-Rhodomonas_salina.1
MAHVPIQKLAKMSHLVDCLPCHLHFPKALRVQCALCYEAKAKRQPFPDASDKSHLPPEFWSAAAHYWTDVYNHVPHSSINDQIPFTVHHGSTPDVSWFHTFGCSCNVFRGRNLVNHHKLAPRGERGVFVGLGMSHGRKCWL